MRQPDDRGPVKYVTAVEQQPDLCTKRLQCLGRVLMQSFSCKCFDRAGLGALGVAFRYRVNQR